MFYRTTRSPQRRSQPFIAVFAFGLWVVDYCQGYNRKIEVAVLKTPGLNAICGIRPRDAWIRYQL